MEVAEKVTSSACAGKYKNSLIRLEQLKLKSKSRCGRSHTGTVLKRCTWKSVPSPEKFTFVKEKFVGLT